MPGQPPGATFRTCLTRPRISANLVMLRFSSPLSVSYVNIYDAINLDRLDSVSTFTFQRCGNRGQKIDFGLVFRFCASCWKVKYVRPS